MQSNPTSRPSALSQDSPAWKWLLRLLFWRLFICAWNLAMAKNEAWTILDASTAKSLQEGMVLLDLVVWSIYLLSMVYNWLFVYILLCTPPQWRRRHWWCRGYAYVRQTCVAMAGILQSCLQSTRSKIVFCMNRWRSSMTVPMTTSITEMTELTTPMENSLQDPNLDNEALQGELSQSTVPGMSWMDRGSPREQDVTEWSQARRDKDA